MAKKKKAAIKRRVPKKKAVKKTRKAPAKTKKPARRRRPAAAPKTPKAPKNIIIGTITHYFPKVRAAVVKLKLPLATGDPIKIKGHTTDFQQIATSMQIDHVPVNQAKKGAEIGLEVDSRVRGGDIVYKQ